MKQLRSALLAAAAAVTSPAMAQSTSGETNYRVSCAANYDAEIIFKDDVTTIITGTPLQEHKSFRHLGKIFETRADASKFVMYHCATGASMDIAASVGFKIAQVIMRDSNVTFGFNGVELISRQP